MDAMEANSTEPSETFPEEVPPKDMELPVPADGVVPLDIQVMKDTELLIIDVSDDVLFCFLVKRNVKKLHITVINIFYISYVLCF